MSAHDEPQFENLGAFQLGDWLPIMLQTRTGAGVPTAPDAKPTFKAFDSSDTLIETINLPASKAYPYITGLFEHKRLLDSSYSTGKYYFALQWAISSTDYMRLGIFEILAGGDADGAVMGMNWFELPESKQVVMALDGGALRAGRNPR